MVYRDYELGSSTRIDESRMKIAKENSKIFDIHRFTFKVTIFTFGCSMYYFMKKFRGHKILPRLSGSTFISLGISSCAHNLSLSNLGNREIFEREKLTQLISLKDIEMVERENEAFKQLQIKNLGKN